MKKLIALGLGLLLLTGCSAINAGYITKKVAEPGNYVTTMSCTTIGEITTCTPITTYDDPDWRFYLVEKADPLNKDRKTGWVYVTPETFDEYEVGDYFEEGVTHEK